MNALRSAAGALRASKRPVEMNIAVLSGKDSTTPLRADPNIVVLGSDDFWGKISGISDFRARLIHATAILSGLITGRAAKEVARIKAEAQQLYDDGHGGLNLDALANPPKLPAATAFLVTTTGTSVTSGLQSRENGETAETG